MNSFNFQIISVANLAAIVTPFPDHICYFTEDTENYYIWENGALKEIFVDTSSITWNNVTNKPTTISGFGITDAVKVNSGTLNYLAKFTPDGTTIGNSQIQDNGTQIYVGSAFTSARFSVNAGSSQAYAGYFNNENSISNSTGILVYAKNAITSNFAIRSDASGGENAYGIYATSDATNNSYGVYATAQGIVKSIGGYFQATGTTKYSLQLVDGTETSAGKYLRNMTTDGKANWANINITEVTNGLSSTLLGAPNGIATLDSSSKLVISQMPISVMDYKGTYDIVTNTPNLQDGVGNQGDVYVCTTAGTRTFGVGNTLTVSVGDWLIYNGTKWEKTLGNNIGSGTVTSVGILLGTTGTDVNISNSPITSSGNINLNIPTASATARGLLSNADWVNFNNKQNTLTFGNLTESVSSVLTITGGTNSLIGSGATIQVKQSSSLQNGFLSSSDWVTFNSKVSAIGGTNNYISKFTPNGTTLGNSQIQDDGTKIGINSAPIVGSKIYIISDQSAGIRLDSTTSNINTAIGVNLSVSGTNNTGNIGIVSSASSGNFSTIGVQGSASSNTGVNKGIEGIASGTSTNIGLRGYAVNGSLNYSIQLQDGTESTGKFLKSITSDGKANWNYLPDTAQIMCSDLVTPITASTTVLKGFWVAPTNGRLTDIFASLLSAQQGGSLFTVQVKMNGTQVALPTFANLTTLSSTIGVSNAFTKGTLFEIFVTQVGDGTAKGLLTTINYERT